MSFLKQKIIPYCPVRDPGYDAAVGAIPVYVSMNPPDWTFSPDDLVRVVTSRTRGLMINTPANPSGKVFSL